MATVCGRRARKQRAVNSPMDDPLKADRGSPDGRLTQPQFSPLSLPSRRGGGFLSKTHGA